MPKAPKGGGRLKKIEVNLKLTDEQREKLLKTLQDRFEENMNRHKSLSWPKVQEKLKKNSQKLASLDRKSTRLNSSHSSVSRMPSSA